MTTTTAPAGFEDLDRLDLPDPGAPGVRVTAGARLADAVLSMALVAVAGLAWTGVYATGFVLPALALSAVLPVAAAALAGGRSGQRVGAGFAAGVGATLAAGIVAAVLAGGSLGDAFAALGTSWSDLLSRTVPVDGVPTLLLVPALTTGAAATVVTVLRGRGRSPLVAILAPAGLVVVARLLGGPAATPRLAVAGVVVLAVLLAAGRAAGPALVRAVPVAMAAAVVALLAGWLLPLGRSRPPVNLRDQRERSLEELSRSNPLTTARAAALADPAQVVATITLDGPAPVGGVLPVVSLDRFDGVDWSSTANYERTGSELPVGGAGSVTVAGGAPLRQEIDVRVETEPWIPAAARPVRVEPADPNETVAVDPASGTVASTRGRLAAGSRFVVTSEVASVTAASAQRAGIPADAGLRGTTLLPDGAPAPIADAAADAMKGASSPFQQASALEAWLAAGGGFSLDPEAPGGSSYGLIARFLLKDGPLGRRGTEQQFVTSFALLARTRGLPTRITVGYRLPNGGRGDGRRTYELRAIDLTAWPEVAFAGVGWVPFDPVPRTAGAAPLPVTQADPVDVAKQEAAQLAADPAKAPPPPAANPVLQSPVAPEPGSSGRLWSAVVGAALALLLVWGAHRWIVPPLRLRRRRRTRRTDPDPKRRALGAWHEVVDALGRRADPTTDVRALSVPEVSRLAETTWGEASAPIGELGRVVTDAAFSPDGATAAQADQAWRLADALPR